MAALGKWEVVGKANKKRGNQDKKREKFKINDAPKIELANPVPPSETIYQAFHKHEKKLNKENNHFNPYEINAKEAVNDSDKGQTIKKPVKKKPAAPKPQKSDKEHVEEAVKNLDLMQLKNILAKDEASYPNNPSLWLKDLASYLHLKFQNVPEKDPVFEKMPADYPSCLLTADMTSFLTEILKKVSLPTLDIFFQYCMNEMVQELSRGHSVYGIQIMIQCTAQVCPKITVNKLEEYKEMLNGRKSQPREALAIMWALGQLPENDLTQGIKVWTTVMMPMVHSKHLAKFSISYLEKLMQNANNCKEAVMSSKDFFNVLALTLGSLSPLANNHNLKRKMLALYPKLKAISFSSRPKSSGHAYFPSLLSYLKCTNEISVEYLTEVLDCLTFCLENDPDCFTIWMELYPTTLVESSVLIYHIVDTWTTRSSKVSKEKFQKAIRTFRVFNSQQEKGKQLTGFEDCILACETAELKFKKKSSCFSIKGILKLFLLILIGAITYDLYKHKGYKGSKTAYFAKQYRIEDGVLRVSAHVKNGFEKGNSWMQTNYPIYYSQIREYVDPAAKYTKDKLVIAGNYVAEQTKPARKYLNKKIPEILEKLEREVPKYWAKVSDFFIYSWNVYWPIVHEYLVLLQNLFLKYVPPYLNKVCEMASTLGKRIYDLAPDFFLTIAVSLEKMSQSIAEKIPEVVRVVQEYAIIASNLVTNLVNNAVSWVQSFANSAEMEDVVTKQGMPKTAPK